MEHGRVLVWNWLWGLVEGSDGSLVENMGKFLENIEWFEWEAEWDTEEDLRAAFISESRHFMIDSNHCFRGCHLRVNFVSYEIHKSSQNPQSPLNSRAKHQKLPQKVKTNKTSKNSMKLLQATWNLLKTPSTSSYSTSLHFTTISSINFSTQIR
jgi:hypothetical protein